MVEWCALTAEEKAESVVAGFCGEVQCVDCGIDTTRQNRVTRYLSFTAGVSRCSDCDRHYVKACIEARVANRARELVVGPDYIEESAPWP